MLPQLPVILWQAVVHENVGSSAVCEGPKSPQIIRLAHSDARLERQQVIATMRAFLNTLRVGTRPAQHQGSHAADKHVAKRRTSRRAIGCLDICTDNPDKAAGERETCEQSD